MNEINFNCKNCGEVWIKDTDKSTTYRCINNTNLAPNRNVGCIRLNSSNKIKSFYFPFPNGEGLGFNLNNCMNEIVLTNISIWKPIISFPYYELPLSKLNEEINELFLRLKELQIYA